MVNIKIKKLAQNGELETSNIAQQVTEELCAIGNHVKMDKSVKNASRSNIQSYFGVPKGPLNATLNKRGSAHSGYLIYATIFNLCKNSITIIPVMLRFYINC